MTGYERSPDYGSPEPSRWKIAVMAVVIFGVAFLLVALPDLF